MMRSASFSASALTVAPAAVNSESGRPDLMPAPGSTATSAPSALNFLIVSGETATRGSLGSISLATAIFMRPPAGKVRAWCQPSAISARMNTGFVTGPTFSDTPWRGTPRRGLDQEVGHQDQDQSDGGGAVLHQHDEALIGRFMRLVVVAVGGGVGHFAMVCHCC